VRFYFVPLFYFIFLNVLVAFRKWFIRGFFFCAVWWFFLISRIIVSLFVSLSSSILLGWNEKSNCQKLFPLIPSVRNDVGLFSS
jgi:hypothetical protein